MLLYGFQNGHALIKVEVLQRVNRAVKSKPHRSSPCYHFCHLIFLLLFAEYQLSRLIEVRCPLLCLALEISELPAFKAEIEGLRVLFLGALLALLRGRAKEKGLDKIEAL
jgi:hypothetical protein